MKTTTKKTRKETAFTIIELLTVMSIIVILLGLLVPAMNKAKIYAKTVNQKNQFHSIAVALELFKTDYEDYPPSDQFGGAGQLYFGAIKLAEAVVGQDLLGFHPDSVFRQDLKDASGNVLYAAPDAPPPYTPFPNEANIKSRKGPYLQIDRANAYRLLNIFGLKQIAPILPVRQRFVLCDEYGRVSNQGTEGPSKIGTPVLYYKADISGFIHDPNTPLNLENIYDYRDNMDLINPGLPGNPSKKHPFDTTIGGDKLFYEKTKNYNISVDLGRPYRPDSYILISAGYDGEYGTEDDIFNFEK